MATGNARARKTDPKLWETVKERVTRGDKGGEAGQWSARKAQLAVSEYKKAGGGYEGGKSEANHLRQWTEEEWGTKSGHDSAETGERYLPKKARDSLTDEEYARTSTAKRRDTAKGRQVSKQPEDVAKKTAKARAPAAKRPSARKATPEKAPATKAPATKAPARSATAKTAPAKKAPAQKAPAKSATAEKTPTRKASAEGAAKRKAAPARKAPATRRASPARKKD